MIGNIVQTVFGAIWNRITGEPVLTLGLVNAGILLAVGFGLNWTRDQVVLVGVFAAALLSFIARRQVTPSQ